MTITGSNTTNFGFQKLGSNDDAGYSTINEVVDGIDTILNASDRLIKASQTPTVAYIITGDGVDWVRGLVVTASITDLNVTTGKLADLSVTTGKINDLAVTTGKINDLAVTSAKIADLTIVDGDVSTSAAIVDTKLATIATANKVSNSATTATSANTANYIVARDGTGNFAAGTITAALTGNASTVTTNANLTGPITSVGNATTVATSVALPGNPTVGTATGSYPTGLGDRTIADVAYVNSAVSTLSGGSIIALNGDVSGMANANSIGASKVTSSMIVNDTIVNGDINNAAAIAYSKLALNGTIVNADVNVSAAIAYSKLNLALSVVNADVSASAAIAYSKLNLAASITSSDIVDGTIVNADVNASAAIAYSKLNLAASITSADIVNGTIVNADINASAAIEDTKLATITTASKVHNSATTATTANTASTIVLRSGAGAFSAGTITATFSGNLTGNASGSSGSCTGNAATAYGSPDSYFTAPSGVDYWVMITDGLTKTAGNGIGKFMNSADSIYSGTPITGRNMIVNSTGTIGSSGSSIRYKEQVTPYTFDINKILSVQPVEFYWKRDMIEWENEEDVTTPQYGFIAEDALAAGADEFIIYNKKGEVESFAYDRFCIALLSVCKQQQTRIDDLEARLVALESR